MAVVFSAGTGLWAGWSEIETVKQLGSEQQTINSFFYPLTLLCFFLKVIYKVLDPAIHVKDPYSLDIQGDWGF